MSINGLPTLDYSGRCPFLGTKEELEAIRNGRYRDQEVLRKPVDCFADPDAFNLEFAALAQYFMQQVWDFVFQALERLPAGEKLGFDKLKWESLVPRIEQLHSKLLIDAGSRNPHMRHQIACLGQASRLEFGDPHLGKFTDVEEFLVKLMSFCCGQVYMWEEQMAASLPDNCSELLNAPKEIFDVSKLTNDQLVFARFFNMAWFDAKPNHLSPGAVLNAGFSSGIRFFIPFLEELVSKGLTKEDIVAHLRSAEFKNLILSAARNHLSVFIKIDEVLQAQGDVADIQDSVNEALIIANIFKSTKDINATKREIQRLANMNVDKSDYLDTKQPQVFPGRTYCPFISKIPDLIKAIADLFEKYYEPESARNV